MIASLSGQVVSVGPTSAVVEVGGLGVMALCSPNTVAGLRVGQHTALATSLIVREDGCEWGSRRRWPPPLSSARTP